MPGGIGIKSTETRLKKVDIDDLNLNERQKKFCLELCADPEFNATKAAERAGYKPSSVQVKNLLRNKEVKKYLSYIQNKRERQLVMKSKDVLEQLSHVVLRDPIDLIDPNTGAIVTDLRKIPKKVRCSIDSIKQRTFYGPDGELSHIDTELKLVSKLPAIELAMKHFGLLQPEQHDVKVSIDWESVIPSGQNAIPDVIEGEILALENKQQ